MTVSQILPAGGRRWMFTGVACAALSLAGAARASAQQDTTHRGMPAMPGMPMPAKPAARTKAKAKPAPKKAKQAAKKPAARAKAPVVPRDSAMKAMHGMAHDTSMKAMPGMGAPDTSMNAMPGMAHDTAMKAMPGMPGHDTTTKPMPGMPMARDTGTRRAAAPGAEMGGMHMTTPDPLGVSMDRMGSGTTWVPDAAPIPSLYFKAPLGWDVTGHGFAFLQYDRQGGDRGASQLGSLNWAMLMASHTLAGGRFQARTMLSLDAITVTPRGYPLLLQSGEAYDGAALHDRQHPHDLFMELSALYEKPLTSTLGLMLYAAPSGEPALGPVAFMHRPSAMDIPTAPITHHWADATHIAFGVLSAGLFTHTLKLEGSLFNGREPDQHRFNFDPITLDSWSGRATYNPTTHWSLSAGYGWLKSPEALNPDESIHRATASVLHGVALGAEGQWSSSVIYGVNRSSMHPDLSHSLLVESEAVLDRSNTVFGRVEWVQKSAEDLVLEDAPFSFAADRTFNVGEASLGYIRDVARFGKGTLGIGAMGTLNVVPAELVPAYGSRTPLGLFIFLRARPFRNATAGAMGDMPGMNHTMP